jgi:hypothetical protein
MEGAEHEVERLRDAFRQRAISLATMSRPLRLVTGFAIAQLLATAVAVAVRSVPGPFVTVKYELNHGEVGVSLVLFLACLVFLSLAWSYLLTGVLHAHFWGRALGLVAFTVAMRTFLVTTYSDTLLGSGILALFWVLALAITVVDGRAARAGAPERAHTNRIRVVTFVLVLILTIAFYAVGGITDPATVGFGVFEQLTTMTFFLIPLLFLAGTDFAEWGEIAGGRIASVVRRRGLVISAATTVVVAAAIAAGMAWLTGPSAIPEQLVLGSIGVVSIGALVRLARKGGRWHPRVSYTAMVLGTGVALVWDLGGSAVLRNLQPGVVIRQTDLGTLEVFAHQHDPQFTIEHPPRWTESEIKTRPAGEGVRFGETSERVAPQAVLVVAHAPATSPASPAAGLPEVVAGLDYKVADARGPTDADGWRTWTFSGGDKAGHDVVGQVRTRTMGDRIYTFVGDSPPNRQDSVLGAYDQMAASFSTTLPTFGEAFNIVAVLKDHLEWLPWVIMGLVAVVMIAARVARRHQGILGTALLFLGIASIIRVLDRGIPGSAGALGIGTTLHGLTAQGTLLTVALLTIIVLAWILLRHRSSDRSPAVIGALLAANLALLGVYAIYILYITAIEAGGTFSLAQGAVILMALLWDITMSGQSVTNSGDPWFPRHARVLMFFGYILLVAAAVLFFSSQHEVVHGLHTEPDFEAELWPALGVLSLGVPFLIAILVLSVTRPPPPAPD